MSRFSLFLLLVSLLGCEKGPQKENPEVRIGFALDGFPIEETRLVSLQQQTAIHPHWIEFYQQWPKQNTEWEMPLSSFDAIDKIGAIPCFTWEPMYDEESKRVAIPYQEILQHHYDGYLEAFAVAIKKWNKPIIIRFAHEMNLKEYHWGTKEGEYGTASPRIYVELFRYLVNFFREKGAVNVLWAFCPNVDSIPLTSWNAVVGYYPGDAYVDILGMDGYNWEASADKRRSFEQIFSPLYQTLKKLSPTKPLIVFETATEGTDQEKQQWFEEARRVGRSWGLEGIIWFQVNKEKNWVLEKRD